MNIGELLNITLVYSTPLILAALGGIFSERSGVVNIGLEGLMVTGAFAAGVFGVYAEHAGMGVWSPWVAMLAAAVLGIALAAIHAVASIQFKADQVISGVVINFLAAGLTLYLVKVLFSGAGETETLQHVFSKVAVPGLSRIPIIGEALFHAYPPTYVAYVLVFVVWYTLFRTPFGLRLRAVGEHPGAADTVGISVRAIRYRGVLLSGALAGIGGAAITLTTTSAFSHNTISGQGFIAIAAMIFGSWHPFGAAGAAVFFGFAQSLRNVVQLYNWSQRIPSEFIYMLPYVLTVLVLTGAVGRAYPPAALGEPYDPGKR